MSESDALDDSLVLDRIANCLQAIALMMYRRAERENLLNADDAKSIFEWVNP